jgi:FixJ family two-component response regulator
LKPVVFFVDDEPNNLIVFESSLPDEWEICCFDNPLEALEKIEEKNPWVIVTDQRMPGISGVKFLELAMKINSKAIRIIATGYSDENLVVESVRTAKIFDYIRKPWDPSDLEMSIRKAMDFYAANLKSENLYKELLEREENLKKQTEELLRLTASLENKNKNEIELREELQSWVPPFVTQSLESKIRFPITKDLVGITFDIVGSGNIHDIKIGNKHARALILRLFSELVMKYGGWRESHSGDSAYAHFGLLEHENNPFEAAMSVAREFRTALRSFNSLNKISIECGIAIHLLKDSIVDIHNIQISTKKGIVIQKSFDTTSIEIDLLHKIEKLTHGLKGSNIIFTEEYKTHLLSEPNNAYSLGPIQVTKSVTKNLYIIPSDQVVREDFELISKRVA